MHSFLSIHRRYTFPKRQGPRPKIALDPAPQKSSWTARQKEEVPESRYSWTTRKQSLLCLSPPRLALGAEESVFMDPHGPTIAPRCPTAVIADKIKHKYFKKRAKIFFCLPSASCPYAASLHSRFNPLPHMPRPGRPSPVCQSGLYTPIRSKTTANFYSRYFLVPEKDGGLRPILDLSRRRF